MISYCQGENVSAYSKYIYIYVRRSVFTAKHSVFCLYMFASPMPSQHQSCWLIQPRNSAHMGYNCPAWGIICKIKKRIPDSVCLVMTCCRCSCRYPWIAVLKNLDKSSGIWVMTAGIIHFKRSLLPPAWQPLIFLGANWACSPSLSCSGVQLSGFRH